MFIYEKKLQFPIRIRNTNPALAKFIISQYGGPYCLRLQKTELPLRFPPRHRAADTTKPLYQGSVCPLHRSVGSRPSFPSPAGRNPARPRNSSFR